jgi:hypothetical protein
MQIAPPANTQALHFAQRPQLSSALRTTPCTLTHGKVKNSRKETVGQTIAQHVNAATLRRKSLFANTGLFIGSRMLVWVYGGEARVQSTGVHTHTMHTAVRRRNFTYFGCVKRG